MARERRHTADRWQEVGRANRFENQAAGEGEGGINARRSQALNQEKGRRVGD